jgi:pseudouridine synthase
MRLNKYLAKAGIASRRAADNLIETGRVSINDSVVTKLGTIVDEYSDKVVFDGKVITLPKEFVYIIINKPIGYLVTCHDSFNRPIILDLIGRYRNIVRPVGRLDLNSTGLLLLTNDGELAFRLTHPRYKIDKQYKVQCAGIITDEEIEKLKTGIELEEGITSPADVKIVLRKENITKLDIIIHEGRKRQIRRMCEKIGHKVIKLHRISIGPITIDKLHSGKYRNLTKEEIAGLKKAVQL